MSVTGGGAGGSIMLDHRGSKSRSPKYGLDSWGDADKPFANIGTENNATAKSIALTVIGNLVFSRLERPPLYFANYLITFSHLIEHQ